MKRTKLMLGDNIQSLQKLPDNSIDSIVTDPPYGLSFMGKKWDYDVPSVEFWKEVYRVLKPGGHVLSFGGTRTYHRMVVNIEDAGFEIRDQIMWLYGSGFPKSHNIGKAVDKLQGNDREVVGEVKRHDFKDPQYIEQGSMMKTDNSAMIDLPITKGNSPYEGWGTALKPANEPICVARKPLSEKSVAENVLKWGTGGINIDGCRVGTETIKCGNAYTGNSDGRYNWNNGDKKEHEGNTYEGRFPANIILECLCDEVIKGEKGEVKRIKSDGGNTENRRFGNGKGLGPCETNAYSDKGDIHTNPMCPCYLMDEQSGVSKSNPRTTEPNGNPNGLISFGQGKNTNHNDKGGASRFFYQAKVSKAERNMGLDGFEDKTSQLNSGGICRKTSVEKRLDNNGENAPTTKNTHPTIKPVSLMAYLCRLVTPPNGIVLDPFMGSGSTGIAALLEGFRFCGMEMDADYFKIAEARIENYEAYKKFIK